MKIVMREAGTGIREVEIRASAGGHDVTELLEMEIDLAMANFLDRCAGETEINIKIRREGTP